MTAHSNRFPGFFGRRDDDAGSAGQPDMSGTDKTGSGETTGGGVSQEPVVVWEAANDLEGRIVKGRLESAGIPAILRGEALGTIYGLTTGNLAATDVLVPAPLAEAAIALLESEVDWEELEEDGDQRSEDPDQAADKRSV
jgi:hypothetical protein